MAVLKPHNGDVERATRWRQGMEDVQRTHKPSRSDWLVWLQWIFWGQWRRLDLCSCCGQAAEAASQDWL